MVRERYTEPLMLLLLLLLMVLMSNRTEADSSTTELDCSASNVSLSRANRAVDAGYKYLVFPQGSNVQLIYCLTIGSFARPQGIFTLGVTAGLAYELPYRRTVAHRKPAEVYHRRSRRDLYRKLEAMLNTQGRDGRGCVLGALCRAGQRNRQQQLARDRASFIQEILHSVFSFPDLDDEELRRKDHGDGHHGELTRHYERAYNARQDCDQLFPVDSCPWLF